MSLPIAYTIEPDEVVVSDTAAAPVGAPAPANAPTPRAPGNVMMVSDW